MSSVDISLFPAFSRSRSFVGSFVFRRGEAIGSFVRSFLRVFWRWGAIGSFIRSFVRVFRAFVHSFVRVFGGAGQ